MKDLMVKNGVLVVLIFGVMTASASDYPKSIQKKINKAAKECFKSEEVLFENLESIQFQEEEYPEIKEVKVNSLKVDGQAVGYAGFASSKGKNDYFDYLVLFDNELTIQKVVMLFYRSSYGGEIMAKFWLKQFEGKSKGENMEFEKDIDSISGATISAPAMTNGIKSLSKLMSKLKSEGQI